MEETLALAIAKGIELGSRIVIAYRAQGHEAYRKIVQWINEVVRGRMPGP